MSTPLRQLLAQYRAASKSEREKGTYFERLAVAFIRHDPGMAQQFAMLASTLSGWGLPGLGADWALQRACGGQYDRAFPFAGTAQPAALKPLYSGHCARAGRF